MNKICKLAKGVVLLGGSYYVYFRFRHVIDKTLQKGISKAFKAVFD